MWLERFLIVVPPLSRKYTAYTYSTYWPTPVEFTILAASASAMILLYIVFSKFVPIIAIWEMKAGEHPSPALYPTAQHERGLGETHA